MIEPDMSPEVVQDVAQVTTACCDKIAKIEKNYTDALDAGDSAGTAIVLPDLVDVLNNHQEEASSDDEDVDDPYMAGFRFCADESVRVLVEELNFASDDPVVLDLKRFLAEEIRLCGQRYRQRQSPEPCTSAEVATGNDKAPAEDSTATTDRSTS